MDDRSGQAGLFNTQEAGLSYALNVFPGQVSNTFIGCKGPLSKPQDSTLADCIRVPNTYPTEDLVKALSSGENAGQYNTSFMTFSTGLYCSRPIKKVRPLHTGISFFDFNKPENSFLGLESHLNSTFVASLGFRAYYRGNISVFPKCCTPVSARTMS
jgi:hypothetical protein